MECTVVDAAARRRADRRRAGLRPRARPVQGVPRQGRRAGDRRHRSRVQHHEQQLGIHRRRPRAGVSRRRRAAGHGVRAVPSDGDDLAAERARHSRHGGRARRGRRAARTATARRFMFDDIPDNYKSQTADNEEEGWRYTQGDKDARRPPELLTRDHVARMIVREVQGGARLSARRRVPRHLVDQGEAPERRGAHQEEAAEHVPPVQAARGHRHHEGADGDRPDDALRDGRHPRRRRHADVDGARAVRLRRMRGGPARREPARRQLAVGPARVRQARRRVRGGVRAQRTATCTLDEREVDAGDALRARAVRSRRERRGRRIRCRTRCRRRCRTSSASCARSTRWSRRWTSSRR